eukprot:5566593-Pyramimonas_sp.AAC.2
MPYVTAPASLPALAAAPAPNRLRKNASMHRGPAASPCRNSSGAKARSKSNPLADVSRDRMTYAVIASEGPTTSNASPQSASPADNVAPCIMNAVLAKSGIHAKPVRRTFAPDPEFPPTLLQRSGCPPCASASPLDVPLSLPCQSSVLSPPTHPASSLRLLRARWPSSPILRPRSSPRLSPQAGMPDRLFA